MSLIHATGLGPTAWRAIAASGATVSLAHTSEPQIGLESAVPAVDEALAVGVRPGLSIDVEVALAGDMFTQMRALLTIQRMRAVNARVRSGWRRPGAGQDPHGRRAGLRHPAGARTCGLDKVTGSLAPGNQADLLMLTADEINNLPLNDPTGTAVLGCDTRNVDTVLVAGQVRKWAGRLTDVDLPALRAAAAASRDRILREAAAG